MDGFFLIKIYCSEKAPQDIARIAQILRLFIPACCPVNISLRKIGLNESASNEQEETT
ncbi:hypothetical protein GH742_05325 [Legionella sp. MW5194]|uniref:hypothetical protein n=1 Tax=Legionella sp. MW5194 TaxID=2662448 RepID=UPI00193CA11C|nr:hypothetical protein [Legionella sp. MW5194]QRN03331.1 hypothetical protein GH742_05325 [Legionella sp. MW5194]